MNRRDFAKNCSMAALSAALCGYARAEEVVEDIAEMERRHAGRKPIFNMHGYAAPACPLLRVGYIGLGNRGFASMKRLAAMEGVEIRALCDCYEYPVRRAQEALSAAGCAAAAKYFQSKDAWREMIAREDLDLVYVTTPPYRHAEMAVGVMEAGKHAATEVPAAQTLTDCWRLVETSERTRRHCVILENCCYDPFEALTTNMAVAGALGEIVHGEGAYIHCGLDWLLQEPMPPLSKESAPFYGFQLNASRGNRYPTHGFGPVCKAMKIAAGDRPEFLTSVESDDFQTRALIDAAATDDNPYFRQFRGLTWGGNINTSLLRTARGKTMMVQYNTKNRRPYSRVHQLVGQAGFVQKYPVETICLDSETPLDDGAMNEVREKYTPELHRHILTTATEFGGHGGMDFTVDWRLCDLLRNGLAMDLDVYDAAFWSAVSPLSLYSVERRSDSVAFPDFTGGLWETNAPIDLSLRGGGNTKVRSIA